MKPTASPCESRAQRFCSFVLVVGIALFLFGNSLTLAQSPAPAVSPPSPAAQEPQPSAAPPADVPKIPNDQLDSLVAPIALYPDPLLSQTLVASTYPLEIIQLHQWLGKNKNLKGKALTDAVM